MATQDMAVSGCGRGFGGQVSSLPAGRFAKRSVAYLNAGAVLVANGSKASMPKNIERRLFDSVTGFW
jgi:hypothetical protein